MSLTHRLRIVFPLLLAMSLSACLFRSRPATVRLSNGPLKSATLPELIGIINAQAARIQTLNATVNIIASTGGSKKGKITEYQEIKGYILVRKPEMLRMIGLMPIVRNKAFDMVSNGETFKLWVPPKNKFIVGNNHAIQPSKQPLENLRPQHIYDALLLRPINQPGEIAVLEQSNQKIEDPKTKKEILQPDYIVDVIDHGEQGWYLSRRISFSRVDLQPVRQRVYDKYGYVATDATYENFKDYNGVTFPSEIRIWRPQEEYAVTLIIDKLVINQPLTNDQFVLNQPPGAQVQHLGSAAPSTASNSSTPPQ